jgi:hypothetical protein
MTAEEARRRSESQLGPGGAAALGRVIRAVEEAVEAGKDYCFVSGILSKKVCGRLEEAGYTVVHHDDPRAGEACTRIVWRQT